MLQATSGQAQNIQIGAEAGISAALQHHEYNDALLGESMISTSVKDLRFAPRIGLTAQYQLGKQAGLHFGLYYTSKGINIKKNPSFSELGLLYHSVELPLAWVYKNDKRETHNFFFGAGGYLAYVLAGNIEMKYRNGTSTDRRVNFGKTLLIHDMRRLEYGLQIQAGLSFQNGWQLRFIAQRQLNNLAIKNNYNAFYRIQNQAYIALTAAYLLP